MIYYKMLFDENDRYGVAYIKDGPELFILPDDGLVIEWHPIRFELRDGIRSDFLANDIGCRLCSEDLKHILQKHSSPNDSLQWLPVCVCDGGVDYRYWILHLPNQPDVLQKDATIFAGKYVVKAVLAESLVNGHHVFAYPQAGELAIFVSSEVKNAVEASRLTGMEYSKIPIRR